MLLLFTLLVLTLITLVISLLKPTKQSKSYILVIILVFLFYKFELVFFVKALFIYSMLPLIYSTSAVLVFMLKYQIDLSDNSYYNLQVRKLFYVFIITFILSTFFIILFYYTNEYIEYVIYLLDLNLGLFMVIGCDSSNILSNAHTLKMNNSSPINVQMPQEEGAFIIANKVMELSSLTSELSQLMTHMGRFVDNLLLLKSDNNLQFVRQINGGFTVNFPDGVPDYIRSEIRTRVAFETVLFGQYYPRVIAGINQSNDILSQIRAYERMRNFNHGNIEACRLQYHEMSAKYESLTE